MTLELRDFVGNRFSPPSVLRGVMAAYDPNGSSTPVIDADGVLQLNPAPAGGSVSVLFRAVVEPAALTGTFPGGATGGAAEGFSTS